jgi:hypothetical protein
MITNMLPAAMQEHQHQPISNAKATTKKPDILPADNLHDGDTTNQYEANTDTFQSGLQSTSVPKPPANMLPAKHPPPSDKTTNTMDITKTNGILPAEKNHEDPRETQTTPGNNPERASYHNHPDQPSTPLASHSGEKDNHGKKTIPQIMTDVPPKDQEDPRAEQHTTLERTKSTTESTTTEPTSQKPTPSQPRTDDEKDGSKCGLCDTLWTPGIPMIQCDGCDGWYCQTPECVKMTTSEFKILNKLSKQLIWTCGEECYVKITAITKTNKQQKSEIKQQREAHRQEASTWKEQVRSLKQDGKNKDSTIKSMAAEIKALSKRSTQQMEKIITTDETVQLLLTKDIARVEQQKEQKNQAKEAAIAASNRTENQIKEISKLASSLDQANAEIHQLQKDTSDARKEQGYLKEHTLDLQKRLEEAKRRPEQQGPMEVAHLVTIDEAQSHEQYIQADHCYTNLGGQVIHNAQSKDQAPTNHQADEQQQNEGNQQPPPGANGIAASNNTHHDENQDTQQDVQTRLINLANSNNTRQENQNSQSNLMDIANNNMWTTDSDVALGQRDRSQRNGYTDRQDNTQSRHKDTGRDSDRMPDGQHKNQRGDYTEQQGKLQWKTHKDRYGDEVRETIAHHALGAMIIGTRGRHIRKFQDDHEVMARIKTTETDRNLVTIQITGRLSRVRSAIETIEESFKCDPIRCRRNCPFIHNTDKRQDIQSNRATDNGTNNEKLTHLKISSACASRISGTQGIRIGELQDKYGTKVTFRRENPSYSIITVEGSSQAVEDTTTQIKRFATKIPSCGTTCDLHPAGEPSSKNDEHRYHRPPHLSTQDPTISHAESRRPAQTQCQPSNQTQQIPLSQTAMEHLMEKITAMINTALDKKLSELTTLQSQTQQV